MGEPDKRPDGGLLIYGADEATAPIRILLEGETVWLTQKMLAGLYQVGINSMNHHIKGVYENGELAPEATIRKYRCLPVPWRAVPEQTGKSGAGEGCLAPPASY